MAVNPSFEAFTSTLPIEIAGRIVGFLPRNGLKNARLVNKAMNHYATKSLFHTVNLRVNMDSLGNLDSISQTQHLSRHVHRIFYDGRLLSWNFAHFDDYVEFGIGYGIYFEHQNSQERARTMFKELFTDNEKINYHAQYVNYLNQQKDLHRDHGELEVSMLGNIFGRLPNFQEVEIDSGAQMDNEVYPMVPDYELPANREYSLSNLTPIAQSTLIAPKTIEDRDYFAVNRIRAVLAAAQESGRNITNLGARVVHSGHFDIKIPPESLATLFGSLVSLELVLKYPRGQGDDSAVRHVLQHTPSLESLSLSSAPLSEMRDWEEIFSYRMPVQMPFSDPLGGDIHLPSLRSVSLDRFNAEPWQLFGFLQNHSSTLESVKLGYFTFNSTDTLLGILTSIRDSTRLKKFHLNNRFDFYSIPPFCNERHDVRERYRLMEFWRFNDTRRYLTCCTSLGGDSCCNLHSLEQYVLRKAPHIFHGPPTSESTLMENKSDPLHNAADESVIFCGTSSSWGF